MGFLVVRSAERARSVKGTPLDRARATSFTSWPRRLMKLGSKEYRKQGRLIEKGFGMFIIRVLFFCAKEGIQEPSKTAHEFQALVAKAAESLMEKVGISKEVCYLLIDD